MVRAGGYIRSLDDLRAVPLRATARGTPVRLGVNLPQISGHLC
jgi:Cu/Ag efflux pump CusA